MGHGFVELNFTRSEEDTILGFRSISATLSCAGQTSRLVVVQNGAEAPHSCDWHRKRRWIDVFERSTHMQLDGWERRIDTNLDGQFRFTVGFHSGRLIFMSQASVQITTLTECPLIESVPDGEKK